MVSISWLIYLSDQSLSIISNFDCVHLPSTLYHASFTRNTLVFLPDDDDCIGDVVIALDSSGSVKNYNWAISLQFVIDVMKGLKISQTKTHVGVVIFSTEVETSFQLNEYFTMVDLEPLVFSLDYMAGATNIADALKRIREVHHATGRPVTGGATIGVIITDGYDNIDYERTVPEATVTKQTVNMFAVGKSTNTHTHTHPHARTHAHTHMRTHTPHIHTQARSRARSRARTYTHPKYNANYHGTCMTRLRPKTITINELVIICCCLLIPCLWQSTYKQYSSI